MYNIKEPNNKCKTNTNKQTIKRMGLIIAIQAEIEGMKWENKLCEFDNSYPKYCETDFRDKAEEIRAITYKHEDQL